MFPFMVYSEGGKEGQSEGDEDGQTEGHEDGHEEGQTEGHEDAHEEGHEGGQTKLHEEGQIHLTVKMTGPYAEWGVPDLARKNKLAVKSVEDLPDIEFKHYICKNGDDDKPDNTFDTKDMKTFMFTKRVKKTTKSHIIAPYS
ncbi:hypothetical protein HanIR_Chr07g0299611 [Helianthus annuus]|nr:hypothetical protein HanIR_Chr07g0299611 [Helianthus annuus]